MHWRCLIMRNAWEMNDNAIRMIENTNLIYLLCPNQMQHAWATKNTNIVYLTYCKNANS
jgi:hypothetical protein